jgi:hypothetical protein
MGLTIILSSPKIALIKLDLPTLGLPIIETLMVVFSLSVLALILADFSLIILAF